MEKILFESNYTNARGNEITLYKNGKVTGIDPFTIYEPMNDYIDAGRQIDQIGLGHTAQDIEWFGFSFKKDSLSVYKLK